MANASVHVGPGSDRTSLDREIRADGRILSTVVSLLAKGTRLSDWPADAVLALKGAVWPASGNIYEMEKARRLRRHLFVDLAPPTFPLTGCVPGRWSDRIRADLPDLVPFATGLKLLDD